MGQDAPRPKYLVVNADEMEPGTFKDRWLLEGNPHQLIEGVIIACPAIQADIAYIFLRKEYTRAEKRINHALQEAYRCRAIWAGTSSSQDINLELHLHVSAGRYMCGEETALLNSLEGRRAMPRSKPPFPQVSGLWGKPTVVNNVETPVQRAAHRRTRASEWYKKLSRSDDGGTKIYGVSGRVKRPGLWELPMGTTIGEIMDQAGGMRDGYEFRSLIPGGASTEFLLKEHFDVKMDFDSVMKAGSRMGTGTMIVLDQTTCPVGALHNLHAVLRPRVLRLVHALPGRPALGHGTSWKPSRTARVNRETWISSRSSAIRSGSARPIARWRRERWSRSGAG